LETKICGQRTGPISGRLGQGQGEEIGPVETPQDFPSRPRCDTGGKRAAAGPSIAVAATGDLMQRPKRKTASRKPRVGFSEPERQRGRDAPAPLFDLADLGAQDFDVRWGRADLMELLVWSFEHVRP
jgi:hypothetical protein